MFVILLSYKKPLNEIEIYLNDHRKFLDDGYQRGFFIASGPKNPRDGGVILSQIKDQDLLKTILEQDPFYIHDIAHFQLIEFMPNKYHPDFAVFVNN